MNHRKALRKLGRNTAHRRALLRNLATALVLNNSIETTVHKAKELKRVADKLVTLGKKNTLAAKREAMSYLQPINKSEAKNANKLSAIHRLFTEIAPAFSDRHGGYTRVVRTRQRIGDNATLAVVQFVEREVVKKEKRKRRVKRAESDKGRKAAPTTAQDNVNTEKQETV